MSAQVKVVQNRNKSGVWMWSLAAGCLAAAAFLPALKAEFVNWDDEHNILENPLIRSVTPGHLMGFFGRLYWDRYTPLTWASWAFNYAFGGLDPLGYHILNVILHGINAAFLFLLIREVLFISTREVRQEQSIRVAALAGALFFAWHPLRVEPVAWATGRRYVLAAAFLFPSFLVYARGWVGRRPKHYLLALGLFIAAVLSNELAAMAAVVFVCFDWWLKRIFEDQGVETPSLAQLLDLKIPFLAIGAASLALALGAHQESGQVINWENYGVLYRVSQGVDAIVFYLVKTIIPIKLSPLYSLPRKEYWDPLAPVFVVCVILAVVLTLVAFLAHRRRPGLTAVWFSYLAFLAPTLGVALSRSFAYDRYSYFAGIPWTILASAGLWHLMQRQKYKSLMATVGIITILGFLSWKQERIWHDSVSLWRHAAALEPGSHHARLNLAQAYERLGQWDQAIGEYEKVLHLYPDHPLALQQLGNILTNQDQPQEALVFYQRALERYPPDNIFKHYAAVTLVNASVALVKLGETERAIQGAIFAVNIEPSLAEGHFQLGYSLAKAQKFRDAIRAFEASLSLRPSAKTHYYLGNALAAIGERAQAQAHWVEARRLEPDFELGAAPE